MVPNWKPTKSVELEMPIIVSHTLILHHLYRQLLLNEIGLCAQNIYTKILGLIVNTNWEGLREHLLLTFTS